MWEPQRCFPARGPEFLAEPDAAWPPAWTSLEWAPPCSPWTAPRLLLGWKGPPRQLDLYAVQGAQADVVDLNRFLMRLSPLLAPG